MPTVPIAPLASRLNRPAVSFTSILPFFPLIISPNSIQFFYSFHSNLVPCISIAAALSGRISVNVNSRRCSLGLRWASRSLRPSIRPFEDFLVRVPEKASTQRHLSQFLEPDSGAPIRHRGLVNPHFMYFQSTQRRLAWYGRLDDMDVKTDIGMQVSWLLQEVLL